MASKQKRSCDPNGDRTSEMASEQQQRWVIHAPKTATMNFINNPRASVVRKKVKQNKLLIGSVYFPLSIPFILRNYVSNDLTMYYLVNVCELQNVFANCI